MDSMLYSILGITNPDIEFDFLSKGELVKLKLGTFLKKIVELGVVKRVNTFSRIFFDFLDDTYIGREEVEALKNK